MKWIFQLKSEDKTLKKSAYAADIFYNMSKWRMKKQPSSFLMLCYVCSKIYSDLLNYERERERRKGGREEGCQLLQRWLLSIFSCWWQWLTMSWWLLIKLTLWCWGSTEFGNGNMQTKQSCFSNIICFVKLLPSEHCINSYFTHDKTLLGFLVSETRERILIIWITF